MSFSLYYTAKRNTPLADSENTAIENIVEKYNSEYPFREKVEDFGVYKFALKDYIIFNGSTKLPDSEFEVLYEVAVYWLKCLTEITSVLHNCQWEVLFDDVYMILDEDTGWRFPTDKEYSKAKPLFRKNDSAMEKLIYKYCTEEYIIDGIRTYIIPKERYDEVYHEIEISDFSETIKELNLSFIDMFRQTDIPEIYPSIAYSHIYMFVHLYKYEGKFYHVALRTGWVCRNCYQPNKFNIAAMPMYESEIDFLPYDVTPEIPPVFKRIPCQKCGKPLNRRFLIIR